MPADARGDRYLRARLEFFEFLSPLKKGRPPIEMDQESATDKSQPPRGRPAAWPPIAGQDRINVYLLNEKFRGMTDETPPAETGTAGEVLDRRTLLEILAPVIRETADRVAG